MSLLLSETPEHRRPCPQILWLFPENHFQLPLHLLSSEATPNQSQPHNSTSAARPEKSHDTTSLHPDTQPLSRSSTSRTPSPKPGPPFDLPPCPARHRPQWPRELAPGASRTPPASPLRSHTQRPSPLAPLYRRRLESLANRLSSE